MASLQETTYSVGSPLPRQQVPYGSYKISDKGPRGWRVAVRCHSCCGKVDVKTAMTNAYEVFLMYGAVLRLTHRPLISIRLCE